MRRFIVACVICISLLAACSGGDPTSEPPPSAADLLFEAVENVRTARSFRMTIEQRGVPYYFNVTLGAGQASIIASMPRAEAQYIGPDVMYATVRLRALGATIQVDLFAREADQWLNALGSGWQQFIVAEDFNAADLVREGSGFQKALQELRDIQFVDTVTLIDGSTAWQVRGFASGQVIYDLLFGLLEVNNDNVTVDVFVDPQTRRPVQLLVTLPDTATEGQSDTDWNIELYDYDQDPIFTAPDGGDL